MGKPRGSQRDAFTPSGAGRRFDREFDRVEVPRFVAKHRSPPYVRRRVVKRQSKTQEGGD